MKTLYAKENKKYERNVPIISFPALAFINVCKQFVKKGEYSGEQFMALRPGRCYRKLHRAFTRQSQRKPRKGYIKGVPMSKITVFELGKKGSYAKTLLLISQRDVQIRHNALEAARVTAVQTLESKLGKEGNYFLKVRVYPHHVIRENALATGAGADRFQQGMRQSFGAPIGTAARVHSGQVIMEVSVASENVNMAKAAFKGAGYKLPTPTKTVVLSNEKQGNAG